MKLSKLETTLEQLAEICDQLNNVDYKSDDLLCLDLLSRLDNMEKELSGKIVLNSSKTEVYKH